MTDATNQASPRNTGEIEVLTGADGEEKVRRRRFSSGTTLGCDEARGNFRQREHLVREVKVRVECDGLRVGIVGAQEVRDWA